MEKLKAHVRFLHDAHKRLLLTYEIFLNNKKISLNLTELMQFLYEKENSLTEQQSQYLYFISRITKKFSYQYHLVYGVINYDDMLNFLLKSKKLDIPVVINDNKKKYKLS